ncbi:MAG: multidrug DMT transporter permease [Alcanivorax sp.]|jgi:hypothetical protein|uniref:hypothetical protein n=1 Tax=Alcanivorax TaxID=59753 RepID=UPI000C36370F|nr:MULTISPECIES: hypothetical protein [Alcanivorax]MAC13302.1 multidrug DMT transporter permease [Alcanivorax sp.]MBG32348.1 multidrug DMT transporter permease [Alcanivorax sp.]MDF1636375.1 hypothetical protein [Alcanivorax jadensis]|tara:strand:- start:12690 stop:14126 length:1437 start_codon:yes stop_codon:yes gene_type:complete
MDELRILIARLGWPSISARWWAMQELAARLGEPDSRVETALLQLLSSCKLEAEVVEILCIFWMATQAHGYSPALNLPENIPRTSILSEMILKSIGFLPERDAGGLEEVPDGFEIPQDFNGVQGSDLPRIFRTSMGKLEKQTRLPFVRQMAFEWGANRDSNPDAPFQGDPWYFLRPLGDGFIGQLSSRAALRAISAYLRTLVVAEELWDIPTKMAEKWSLLALPVHPSLAFLRPRRPAWFPRRTDFDGDTEEFEESLRSLVDRVRSAGSGEELIAFSSPIVMSMERCVEVSVVRWLQSADSHIADSEVSAHLDDFWTSGRMLPSSTPGSLSTTSLLALPNLDGLIDMKCKAWPLAVPLGLERLGYLQHDLYPGRLFLPTQPASCMAELLPRDGGLEVKVDTRVIADLCYWNAGWGAVRPMQFSGNCGTALTSRGTIYREKPLGMSGKVRSFFLWQVRTLQREGRHDQFKETLASGAMYV